MKNARLNAGLTQEEVAVKLGVSRQVVSMWETGRKSPSSRNLKKLADLLSVTVDSLLADKKNAVVAAGNGSSNIVQINNGENNGAITQTVNEGVSQNNGESSGGTMTDEAVSLPSALYSDLKSALRLRRERPSLWRVMCAGGLSDEQVLAVARALEDADKSKK